MLLFIAWKMMQDSDQSGSIVGASRRQILYVSMNPFNAPGKSGLGNARQCQIQHGFRRIDGHESPLRLKPRSRQDFVACAACTGHEYRSIRALTKDRCKHASGQFVAGVIAGKRDPALFFILRSTACIELMGCVI